MARTKKPSSKPYKVEDDKDNMSGVEEKVIETEVEEQQVLDLGISQLDGVGAVTAKKLTDFGVSSIIDICIRGGREISEITGVTKAKADGWVFNAQKILEDNNLIRK